MEIVFTPREKETLAWLVLGELSRVMEELNKVAGEQLDYDASDPIRGKLERIRVSLNERVMFLENLLFKVGYKFGGVD